MQIPEIIKDTKTYQKSLLIKNNNNLSDYDRGVYNGLEMSLALFEKRPAFLLNRLNKFNQSDMDAYPEYFL